jgi:hypothetical protein
MKRLVLLLVGLVMMSCETPENPDCGCNRIQEPVSNFVLSNGYSFGGYSTKNDCSGEIKNYQYSGTPPKAGNCKK